MDVYELSYPGNTSIENDEQYSLAIGFFDGLHKGHQTVINKAIGKAKELGIRSAILSILPAPFDPNE